MQLVGSFKNDSASGHEVGLVALQGFECAFLDNHQFFVRVAMRRMRRFSRIERGDVAFQIRQCRRGRVENRAAFALFGRHGLQISPV